MSTLVASTLTHPTAGSIGVTYLVNAPTTSWATGQANAAPTNSYNIGSTTDHGVGDFSFTMTAAHSSNGDYAQCNTLNGTGQSRTVCRNTDREAAGTIAIEMYDGAFTLTDIVYSIYTTGVFA